MKAMNPAQALQMLDAVHRGFAEPDHHAGRGREPALLCEPHHLDPAVRRLLLGADPPANLVREDLGATARQAFEPGRDQAVEHGSGGYPLHVRDVLDLGGREGVDLDRGEGGADPAQQVFVPREVKVRMVPALHQDAAAADRHQLGDLLGEYRPRVDVALGMARRPVEGAELAVGDADVRVIDVAIDQVGHAVGRDDPRPAPGVGGGEELGGGRRVMDRLGRRRVQTLAGHRSLEGESRAPGGGIRAEMLHQGWHATVAGRRWQGGGLAVACPMNPGRGRLSQKGPS
jgi:hypothetical protein